MSAYSYRRTARRWLHFNVLILEGYIFESNAAKFISESALFTLIEDAVHSGFRTKAVPKKHADWADRLSCFNEILDYGDLGVEQRANRIISDVFLVFLDAELIWASRLQIFFFWSSLPVDRVYFKLQKVSSITFGGLLCFISAISNLGLTHTWCLHSSKQKPTHLS